MEIGYRGISAFREKIRNCFPQDSPENRKGKPEPHQQRMGRQLSSHRMGQKLRNRLFCFESRYLKRLRHGPVTQWQEMIEEIPVHIEAEAPGDLLAETLGRKFLLRAQERETQ
jgi:hypothetical protein